MGDDRRGSRLVTRSPNREHRMREAEGFWWPPLIIVAVLLAVGWFIAPIGKPETYDEWLERQI